MQVTPHVYVMHIDDDSVYHPGGSNNYFVGDPREEMLLIDTGDQQREWTQSILEYYAHLGRPKISAILLTHSHQDHIGGLDRIYDVVQAPVRCHPKLVKKLASMVGPDAVVPLKAREMVRTGGDVAVQAIFTPGHEVDHVAFHLRADRVLFTGDCVLGASSSTVRDLASYMKSLQLLTTYQHDTICPGHGPSFPHHAGRSWCAGTCTTARNVNNRSWRRWPRASQGSRRSPGTSIHATCTKDCVRGPNAT